MKPSCYRVTTVLFVSAAVRPACVVCVPAATLTEPTNQPYQPASDGWIIPYVAIYPLLSSPLLGIASVCILYASTATTRYTEYTQSSRYTVNAYYRSRCIFIAPLSVNVTWSMTMRHGEGEGEGKGKGKGVTIKRSPL